MESLLKHLGAILSALVFVGLFGAAMYFSRLRPYWHTFSRRDKVLLWVMAVVHFLLFAFWSVGQLDWELHAFHRPALSQREAKPEGAWQLPVARLADICGWYPSRVSVHVSTASKLAIQRAVAIRRDDATCGVLRIHRCRRIKAP